MEFRHYQDSDYDALIEFFITLNRTARTHVNWNWARFEWMAEHPEFDREHRSSIGLWFDGENVVAAAVYDMYFGEAFQGVLPGYEELRQEVLDYCWQALRDDNGLGIAVNDRDAETALLLRNQGFVPADQTETILALPLDKPLSVELPAGFRIVEPDPVKQLRDLQWLFWQGFDHGEDRAEFEKEDHAVSGVRKHARAELNLAAESPRGELVSFTGVWFHDAADYAYVEPVCTIPSCRGRGIARALLSEALNRARLLGAKTAYVISDLPFYKKMGFSEDQHYIFYWKKDA